MNLKLVTMSCRWTKATRKIVLCLRAKQRIFLGSQTVFGRTRNTVKATSFLSSGVQGPQLSLEFTMAPPQPKLRGNAHRPYCQPAELNVQAN